MTVACVLITHLPAKAELMRRAGLRGRPVIIAAETAQGPVALDASAEAAGVMAGMPLQEALSRCRKATLVEADEPHYLKVFDRVIDALLARSPVVEKGELGRAYVGVSGLEALYGGEPRVIAGLLNAVPSALNPRIGVAQSKFPAYIAAVTADEGRAIRVPDDVRRFLARHPVDLLPLSWDDRVRLHRFGLHTIGQIAAMSVGPLQAQLGADGRLAWELANGMDRDWLVSHRQEHTVTESLTFPAPATTLYTVLIALDTLLGRAFSRPAIKGKYVRMASMRPGSCDGVPGLKAHAFKTAVNSRYRALLALRSMLGTVELPGALEDIRLTLSGITGESGVQSSLFSDVRKQVQLRETMRQLEARLRTRPPIYKVMEVEPWSRLPERRRALVQFEPLNLPAPVEVEDDDHHRPTSMALRGRKLDVASIEEVWEVVEEWWRTDPIARRYFRVIVSDGSSATVFRDLKSGAWYEQRV